MAFDLPPLNTLRMFEAASRLGSFKAAAEELHLTPSAVSHGIMALEKWFGTPLFLRQPGGLALTDAATRYLPFVERALQDLPAATDSLPGREPRGRLALSVVPTFASCWLLPRLARALEVLGITERTVRRDWEKARLLLAEAMG
jgi:LysR family transcriptional regulator, glycine cleavage system transcriptional activator